MGRANGESSVGTGTSSWEYVRAGFARHGELKEPRIGEGKRTNWVGSRRANERFVKTSRQQGGEQPVPCARI